MHIWTHGMIFTLIDPNWILMSDLLLLTALMLGTYLCCAGFTVLLVRIFFPLRTKEEMEELKLTKTHATQQAVRKSRAVTLPLLNRSRRLA